MAINFGDQGSVDLGRSRAQPIETYSSVRSLGNEGSGFEELAKSLGKLGVSFEQSSEEAAREDQRNSQVYAQRLQAALKGGTPTDDDVKNILSDRHHVVRARAAEDYGFINGLNAANESLRTLPQGLMPEEYAAKSQEILAKAAADSKGNLSYQAGYLKAFNSLIMERSKKDGDELSNEFKKRSLEGMELRGGVAIDSYVSDFKAGRPVNAPVVPSLSNVGKQSATPEAAGAIVKSANNLGIDPKVLAAVISYETGGTFSTDIMGGKDGAYQGLIQFSPENRKLYGIKKGMSFGEQMDAVEKYLKDRGVKPGMGTLDVYAAINAGRAGDPKLYGASDGNGTVRSHTAKIEAEHFGPAEEFLKAAGVEPTGRTRVASLGTANDASSTAPAAVDGGSNAGSSAVQTADASGRVPVVVDTAGGKATLNLSSDQNLQNVQLNIYNDWKRLDDEYGRTSNTTNRERRDRYVDMIRLKAINHLMPEILDSIPENLLTNEQKANFIVARNTIRERKEHEDTKRYTDAKRREQAASDEVQTQAMQKYKEDPDAFLDPYRSAQYEYIDANGKKVTSINKDLVAFINGLNDPQTVHPLQSQGTAATVSQVFSGAYITDDWSNVAKQYPEFAPLVADGRKPTDDEVRAFMAKLPINKKDKLELAGKIGEWKDSYSTVHDPALKEHYAGGIQSSVNIYMQSQAVTKKLAEFDPQMQGVINKIPGTVKKAYESEYLGLYNAYVKDNNGQKPSETLKLQYRKEAEKKANEVFLQQQQMIDKFYTGGTQSGGSGGQNSQAVETPAVGKQATGTTVIGGKEMPVSGTVRRETADSYFVVDAEGNGYQVPKKGSQVEGIKSQEVASVNPADMPPPKRMSPTGMIRNTIAGIQPDSGEREPPAPRQDNYEGLATFSQERRIEQEKQARTEIIRNYIDKSPDLVKQNVELENNIKFAKTKAERAKAQEALDQWQEQVGQKQDAYIRELLSAMQTGDSSNTIKVAKRDETAFRALATSGPVRRYVLSQFNEDYDYNKRLEDNLRAKLDTAVPGERKAIRDQLKVVRKQIDDFENKYDSWFDRVYKSLK